MKKLFKLIGIITLVAIIGFSFATCSDENDDTDGGGGGGGGTGSDPSLLTFSGNITISPNSGVTTYTELTATYSGNETVTYQWKNGSSNVGTNSNKYTPTDEGSYTVTVSAVGYNPKTSDPVTVALSNLSGNITISPNSGVTTYTELTATYSGNETVIYQWKNGSSNVGTNSNKYTPTDEGSYTVTVSAIGYNPKTSDPITVALSNLSGNITISPNGTVAFNTQLTATYSGSETVTYQWKNDSSNVGTNSNKYTPTTRGSFTVTVSAKGYNSKTSNIVTINATQLTVNTLANGNISQASGEQWFYFTATASTQIIRVNFGGTLDDLYVQGYDSDGTMVGDETRLNNGGNTIYIFRNVTNGQEYYIKVRPYGSKSGTYQLSLFTPQQLIANNWTNGNISQPSGEQWFYFTAIAYTQYIHISFDTLNDVWVSVYTSSGTVVGVDTNLYGLSGSTKNFNKTITNGQGHYIRVRSSSSSGTYKIAFNTSTTAPN
jgi:hypothetical protein